MDEFEKLDFLILLWAIFATVMLGAVYVASAESGPGEAGPDSPVLMFSQDGLYDRGLSVDLPGSGATVDCGVSRRNEFQVSESVFLYNSTSCSTSFSVGDGNFSVNSSDVDILFKVLDSLGEFQLGYDFGESALVCNVSEGEDSQGDVKRFPADCSRVEEDISRSWNNESFSDFNVIERGQEALENQSTG